MDEGGSAVPQMDCVEEVEVNEENQIAKSAPSDVGAQTSDVVREEPESSEASEPTAAESFVSDRVQLQNLPQYCSYKQVKSLLAK